MSYGEDPQRILLENRTGNQTMGQVSNQISAIAKILIDQQLASQVIVDPTPSSRAPKMPVRSLNSDFVISTTQDAIAFYTTELTASRILTGTDYASVDLIVNGVSIGTVKNLLTVTLALGVGITNTHQKILMGFIQSGSTVSLTSSGSATLMQSMEVLL